MNGKIYLLPIFFLGLHVVASYDKSNIAETNYKLRNEKAEQIDKHNRTGNEEPFIGQNIISYFKNILNDFNNDLKEDSNAPENGKLTGQVSEEDPTNKEGINEENAPEEKDAQSGEEGGVAEGEQNDGGAESTLPVQGEEYDESSLNYADDLYEDILSSLSKKGGEEGTNYDDKYNEFKKEYDRFISLSKDEYEIIGKLIDAFSMYNDAISEDTDSVYQAIKKSFTDTKFKQEFKDFMNGLYTYTQKKHNIRGSQTEDIKKYLMLFQNIINYLSMI